MKRLESLRNTESVIGYKTKVYRKQLLLFLIPTQRHISVSLSCSCEPT